MIREAVAWWLAVEVVGLVALPITLLLFRNLSGRGFAFAKPVGLLLGGYLFWLGMEAHLLPNRPGSIFWAFVPLLIADVFILSKYWQEFLEELEERWAFIVAVEGIFFAFFFVGAHVRSFIPEAVGTEKPMDFMLLTTAARSRFYPPADSWFSGAGVSYYYFGYVIQAMVAKISATAPPIAFNLALASTAALAASTAFGLAYEAVNLLRRVPLRYALAAGAGAVLLVAVMGNLEGVLEFAKANDKLPQSIERKADIASLADAKVSEACLLKNPLNSSGCFVKYPSEQSSFWWWWRSTRISAKADTITEFPFFSFLLGDLHPHVMAIPFVFTTAALALMLWKSPHGLSWLTWQRRPWLLAASAVLVGALGFINTWDLPTGFFLIGLLVLARNLTGIAGDTASPQAEVNARALAAFKFSASFLLPLYVLAVALYLPFYMDFGSQAGGLDAVRDGATRPSQLFLFWAPMLTIGLAMPLVMVVRDPASRVPQRLSTVALLLGALFLLWAVVLVANNGASAIGDAVTARGLNWLVTLFLAAAVGIAALALWRAVETYPSRSEMTSQIRDEVRDSNPALLVPVLAMTFTALLLILGCELFFIQDVFKSRVNTVFKLYYQAWLLLGVSGAVSAYWLLSRPKTQLSKSASFGRDIWWAVALVLVAAALLYPLGGVFSRTEGLSSAKMRSLDALFVARSQSPEDFAAVEWLRTRAGPGEVLVEATANDYTLGGRISAWSGVPAVLGWGGHERQWGRAQSVVTQRQTDVDAIYNAPTLADALPLLRKYGVTYVIVGGQEVAKYPPPSLVKFESLPQAFRLGQTTIYRVPAPEREAQ